jgi:cardiolipin synthase
VGVIETITQYGGWVTTALFALDLVLRVAIAYRIVMRRLPVGVSLAWLTVILSFPYVGVVVYALLGRTQVGRQREKRLAGLRGPAQSWLRQLRQHAPAAGPDPAWEPLSRLAEAETHVPALAGNRLDLLDRAAEVFRALVADIDAAERSCDLEFYIWTEGGDADHVVEALVRAAGRGVRCRVLVDALGSRAFLRGDRARRLRDGGARVVAAMPVSLGTLFEVRADLRLHRKIVVIDGRVGYTGSQNLVDPRFFKQGAGVGEWVDAMVRVYGPAVGPLHLTFLGDWQAETGEVTDEQLRAEGVGEVAPQGPAVVQAVPSGPSRRGDAITGILLAALHAARTELVLTTPYLVPDEALLAALTAAARRGVSVTVVVPQRVDSRLVRYASRAYQEDLLAAGARVVAFRGGLLHTKSIAVDGAFSLFGSLNLDQRSLRLDFEISLIVYDRDFTARLRRLQDGYIKDSVPLSLKDFTDRSQLARLAENTARLVGPLL